jgi:hypothetical protein
MEAYMLLCALCGEKIEGSYVRRVVDDFGGLKPDHKDDQELLLDYLLKIDSSLKAVEDEQRWIPVGESQYYPKNCNPILVVTKKKTILVARYLRGRDLEKIKWEADYIPCDAFYEIDDHQKLFWQIHGVTHWRPLPEGPRKKEVQE